MYRAVLLLAAGCSASAVSSGSGHVSTAQVTSIEVDEVTAAHPQSTPDPIPPAVPEAPAPTPPASPVAPAPEQPFVVGLLDGEFALEDAWDRWRKGNVVTFDAAFEIAVLANRARPLDMSDELMVIALSRAVELSECDPERLGKVRLLAIAVRTAHHPLELDPELTRLADMGPTECGVRRN
jgi:hypothetical protein